MRKIWISFLLVLVLGIFAFIFLNNNFIIKSDECFDNVILGEKIEGDIQKSDFDKLIYTCEDGVCRNVITECRQTEVDELYFISSFDCKPELISCKDSCDELYENGQTTKIYRDFCRRECRKENCEVEIFNKSNLSIDLLKEKCSEENNIYSCSYGYVVEAR